MKPKSLTALAIAGISIAAQNAGALPIDNPTYQDIDAFMVTLNKFGPSVSGTFDITSRPDDGSASVTINNTGAADNRYLNALSTYNDILGFIPGPLSERPETIISANAFFYLRGANGQNDVYTLDLTDFLLDSVDTKGNGSHIILGGGLGSIAIDFLNMNGILDYTVTRDGGSFTFDYAQLQVVTVVGNSPPGDSVPEAGSTAGMLAGAFFLTGLIARRKNK